MAISRGGAKTPPGAEYQTGVEQKCLAVLNVLAFSIPSMWSYVRGPRQCRQLKDILVRADSWHYDWLDTHYFGYVIERYYRSRQPAKEIREPGSSFIADVPDDPYAISYLKFQDEAEEFMLSIEFIMPDEFSRRMNDDEILQLILSLEPDEKLRGKTRRRPRRNI